MGYMLGIIIANVPANGYWVMTGHLGDFSLFSNNNQNNPAVGLTVFILHCTSFHALRVFEYRTASTRNTCLKPSSVSLRSLVDSETGNKRRPRLNGKRRRLTIAHSFHRYHLSQEKGVSWERTSSYPKAASSNCSPPRYGKCCIRGTGVDPPYPDR